MPMGRLTRGFLTIVRLNPLLCRQCSRRLASVVYFAAISSGLFFPWVFASNVGSGSPWVPVVFPRVLLALLSPHLFDT